jgi:hypothetical protein
MKSKLMDINKELSFMKAFFFVINELMTCNTIQYFYAPHYYKLTCF